MSQLRLARLSMLLVALGLNAAPALVSTAHAQYKASASASASADAVKPDTVRAEMFKLLDPNMIKELMAAKKFAEVQKNIDLADAFADKTPYEIYVLDRMRLALAFSTNNDQLAIKSLEAVIASGRVPAADQVEFIQALANYYYNAKNYAKAIEWMKRHQKESGNPDKVRGSLVRAYYLSDDFTSAKRELIDILAKNAKDGKTPDQEDLRLLASSAVKLKDTPTVVMALEKLVQYYPTDEFWFDLLGKMQNKPTFNFQRLGLDALRLKATATKTMEADEYADLAELALQAGLPVEAKKTLDKGFASGLLGTGPNAAKHKKLRDQANKSAADDAKNIAAGDAAAMKSKDGLAMVNLGLAYVTMDQADKGIDLIEKGIAKGGLKRPEEAKLHLGIAFAMANRKADALKTFESVKGDDGLSDLARYWSFWVNRPVPAAAPAAPAAK